MAGPQSNSSKWTLGLMQGRLVPRYKGRYQAFPRHYWEAEFHMARELGFKFIEFILDYNEAEENPLMSSAGVRAIQNVVRESGVGIRSICADYFMEAPFHSKHQAASEKVLQTLLESAAVLGAKDVVIPCVDQSKLKDAHDVEMVVESVRKFLPLAQKLGIFLNFETDLSPADFKAFLGHFDSPQIKVNYDIGNSAALGYSPPEEFRAYGPMISNLHIKDRQLGGSSVKLGTGNAKFDEVFGLLREYKFDGIITMQASRHPEFEKELPHVADQRDFTNAYIERYL